MIRYLVKDSSKFALAVVLASLVAVGYSSPGWAAGGGAALESPRIDGGNKKSLQRGAAMYVNYCMGCHEASYHRYSRLASDLGLDPVDVSEQLIFTTDEAGAPSKVGSLMTNNMGSDYARKAFGVIPPNLALTARSRGVDWIYTYMKSFYLDPDRAGVGVNNTVYPGAAMPHVLWELQGWQKPVYEDDGEGHSVMKGFELVSEGSMSPDQYDKAVSDLVNFLAYLSDPIKQQRHKIGMWVILFLFVLLGIAYMLKKEYWKDVVH